MQRFSAFVLIALVGCSSRRFAGEYEVLEASCLNGFTNEPGPTNAEGQATIGTQVSIAETELDNTYSMTLEGIDGITLECVNPEDWSQLFCYEGGLPDGVDASSLAADMPDPDYVVSWGESASGQGVIHIDEFWLDGTEENCDLLV